MTIIASAKPPPPIHQPPMPPPWYRSILIDGFPFSIYRGWYLYMISPSQTVLMKLKIGWQTSDRYISNHWYFLLQRWCRFIIYLFIIYLLIYFISFFWFFFYKNCIFSNKIYNHAIVSQGTNLITWVPTFSYAKRAYGQERKRNNVWMKIVQKIWIFVPHIYLFWILMRFWFFFCFSTVWVTPWSCS